MQFGWLTLGLSPSPDDGRRRHRRGGRPRPALPRRRASTASGSPSTTSRARASTAIPSRSPAWWRRGRRGSASASRCIQLALRHPIRLATELALLDNLSAGRLDVGVGHGTNYNEYEFVGYGLRSDDSRARMEETLEVMVRAWTEAPLVHHGKFYQLSLPALRPRPRQRPYPPVWRAVSSAGSVRECGRLGAPILMARIPIARVPERLALYATGLEESGLDPATRQRLREQAALWRFVHVADSQAQAEDELAAALAGDPPPHGPRARRPTIRPTSTSKPPVSMPGTTPRLRRGRRPLRARSDRPVRHPGARGRTGRRPPRRRRPPRALPDERRLPAHATILDSMRRFGEQVRPRFQS